MFLYRITVLLLIVFTECSKELQEVEKARHGAGAGEVSLTSSTGGKTSVSKQKKTKGASLVNPSSKR